MELQFEDIEKSYKDKKVLKGISVTMGTGVYGVRVIAKSRPADNAVQAVPNLEDAYLYIFNFRWQ